MWQVLCNGPALCVIVAGASWLVSAWTRSQRPKIVYVESFARTQSLSLSGHIMRLFTANFLVQWTGISTKSDGILMAKQTYIGLLV